MKTFIYYPKNLKNKEIVGMVKAEDEYGAIIKAASNKNLPTSDFLLIFNLEEYEERTKI